MEVAKTFPPNPAELCNQHAAEWSELYVSAKWKVPKLVFIGWFLRKILRVHGRFSLTSTNLAKPRTLTNKGKNMVCVLHYSLAGFHQRGAKGRLQNILICKCTILLLFLIHHWCLKPILKWSKKYHKTSTFPIIAWCRKAFFVPLFSWGLIIATHFGLPATSIKFVTGTKLCGGRRARWVKGFQMRDMEDWIDSVVLGPL